MSFRAEATRSWLVERAGVHLRRLAKLQVSMPTILSALVDGLIADWRAASADVHLPPGYDPPAACLVLIKRYDDAWRGLRLGDSCLLARSTAGDHQIMAASPNNAFDHWLAKEAKERRDQGISDTESLLAEFRWQMLASRQKRNKPNGYSILEADRAALTIPEFFDLESTDAILLCTDGFYRAVDHYGLYSNESLMAECENDGGVDQVLGELRMIEAADPSCDKYPRFKPADDATAVMLKCER